MTPDEAQQFRIEALNSVHDRTAFSCGNAALNTYMWRQARQDQDRNLAAVYVLTPDGQTIAGFYTLSGSAVQAHDLPEKFASKLPRFPIPVTLLGRMAVQSQLQGKGIGKLLLFDALARARLGSAGVASWAVVVDAKEGVRDFYLQYDFTPFPAQPQRLFLTTQDIRRFGF